MNINVFSLTHCLWAPCLWERGLSVPDSEMLVSISDILDTPISTLLGETITENSQKDLKVISEKLEVITLELARQKAMRRNILHWIFLVLSMVIVAIFIIILMAGSPYLNWDYSDPETAVAGTILHGFEFVFVRIAPFAFCGFVCGAV
ncbi:MAG: hypothetical protein K6A61_02610, partial [Butyrivibrio sp.]|nr:hypothetical protein [Butyrivibrio sp.]